ncbi:DUF3108 domain-containing protein [Flammeovirga kamogawensis]|uniref:DUF3108 domain-containing protein n=1 Tax=Flammeovirga kamogawensis TaxID=373891 RepID=A0ABX8GZG0_9BACT|nr:DUF3108 domain-containing protein [Flammeovirga kamogawensis]MBB6459246.1 hypothetical protein [Flammeovirga kamogawensis]QWG08808.1 DUF3108 domain-containing protein [Flammeovirga kamogawensis]TRX67097.1 DUF3108 domain-containing protein [Flammeovirga kamogawensis]
MRLNTKYIKITAAILFIGFISFSFKTEQDPPIKSDISFEKGETLTYVAGYSVFEAGEAVVHLDKKLHQVNGEETYKVNVTGRSIGMFGMTMKIRDLWQSYFSTSTLYPVQFNRDIIEGGYTLEETINFDQVNGKADTEWKKKDKKEIHKEHYEMPPHTHDVISGYYYLRTLDYDQMTKGDTISLNSFWENKAYDFDIVYLGVEKVYTKFGRIESYVMSPIMPENQLFSGTHPIKFWVSKDINRIPLKIQAELIVGSVNVDLVRYKGLKQKLKKSK